MKDKFNKIYEQVKKKPQDILSILFNFVEEQIAIDCKEVLRSYNKNLLLNEEYEVLKNGI